MCELLCCAEMTARVDVVLCIDSNLCCCDSCCNSEEQNVKDEAENKHLEQQMKSRKPLWDFMVLR